MKLALLLLLTLAAPALAWNEPDSVRDVPWGATQEELRAQLQRAGEIARCYSPQHCVSLRVSVGPVPVNIQYVFPKDGKLEMAILTFPSGNYQKLRAAFVERYGAPTSVRQEKIQGQGCTTATEVVEWSGERVVIDLRRFATKNAGRATITLKASRDREHDTVDGGPEKEQG